jgi:hypothetical protein
MSSFGILYAPLKEWEETMEEFTRDDAFHDNCHLFELLNQVRKELGKGT